MRWWGWGTGVGVSRGRAREMGVGRGGGWGCCLGAAEVKAEAGGRWRVEGGWGWGCACLWVVSEVWGWLGCGGKGGWGVLLGLRWGQGMGCAFMRWYECRWVWWLLRRFQKSGWVLRILRLCLLFEGDGWAIGVMGGELLYFSYANASHQPGDF